jgi:pyruvate/2-oxoglutarate dehydrogenase complex dihydrolipoamide dehydrogenase (E3) component
MHDVIVLGDSPAAVGLARAALLAGSRVALVVRPGWGSSGFVTRDLARDVIRDAIRGMPGQVVGSPAGALAALRAELARRQRLLAASPVAGGLELLVGIPRLAAFDTVEVNGRELRARRIVIALEGRPAASGFAAPIGHPRLLDTNSFWTSDVAPASMAVAGAGEAWEYAQLMARCGMSVTLVAEDLGPATNPALAPLAATLRVQGVHVVAGSPRAIEARGSRLVLRTEGGEACSFESDSILLAGARTAAHASLGLERLGLPIGPNHSLAADSRLSVVPRRIWAMGESMAPGLDPEAAGLHAATLLSSWAGATRALGPVPRTIGTDPAVVSFPLEANAAALANRELETPLPPSSARGVPGRLSVHLDNRGRLLGASVCDREALRLVDSLARALRDGWTLERLVRDLSRDTACGAGFATLAARVQDERRRHRGTTRWIRHLAGYLADDSDSPPSSAAVDNLAPARRP